MEKEYTYSAFISYSSKDEKVAKALWKKLEHYRLPSVLQKQYEDIPEKMHVFLDQGDIVPGDTVENALSRELADSRKLIVICSPNSAKSPYVELEVKNFLSLGHSPNDIIPYIIEGEVNRESLNNCYVPSLFGKTDKETINGVSLLRDGKWKAFVGVLANLLDVKFDEIYKREKVRKNRTAITLSGGGLLLACLVGFIIWYVRPHHKYYIDYVTKWGIPEGVSELKKKNIKKYPNHYKITYQYLRPIKIEYENISGEYVYEDLKTNERPFYAEFYYKNTPNIFNDNDELDYAVYLINNYRYDDWEYKIEKVYLKYNINKESSKGIVHFFNDENFTIRKSITDNYLATPINGQSTVFSNELIDFVNCYHMPETIVIDSINNIMAIDYQFDKTTGYVKKLFFKNQNDEITEDKNGVIGFSYNYNENGQEIERYILRKNVSLYGDYLIKFKYDQIGRLRYKSYIRNNDTVLNAYNFNLEEKTYHISETIIYDDENLTETFIKDCHLENGLDNRISWSKQFNKKGNIVNEDIVFLDGQVRKEYVYKKNQLTKKITYNDTIYNIDYYYKNGKPIEITRKYEKPKNETRDFSCNIEYFDNQLIKSKEIKSKTTKIYTEYDTLGRCIKENASFDDSEEDSIIVNYKGINKEIIKINKQNGDEKYEKYEFLYDSNDNLIHCECKNSVDDLILSHMGFSTYDALYSDMKLKKCSFFDTEGKPIIPLLTNYPFSNYYAEIKKGKIVSEKYLAPDNSYAEMPVFPKYSFMECIFNQNNNKYNLNYYDSQGKLESTVEYENDYPKIFTIYIDKDSAEKYKSEKGMIDTIVNTDIDIQKYDSYGRLICLYSTQKNLTSNIYYYSNCLKIIYSNPEPIFEFYSPNEFLDAKIINENEYKDFVKLFVSEFDLSERHLNWVRYKDYENDLLYISDLSKLISLKLEKDTTNIIKDGEFYFTIINNDTTDYYTISNDSFEKLFSKPLIESDE